MIDANLLSSDVKRPRRACTYFVRTFGRLDGTRLSLDQGTWVRSRDAEGAELDDRRDRSANLNPRKQVVVAEVNGAGVCALRLLQRLDRFGCEWRVERMAGDAFEGALVCLPAHGVRL